MAQVVHKEVFIEAPDDRTGVMGGAYYTRSDADELLAIYSLTRRSDTVDVSYRMRSEDNGRTWGPVETVECTFDADGGTGRRHPRGGYVDEATGRFITVWTEGVLPTDDPLEGMYHWTLHYSVSEDGGRTSIAGGQIIHAGDEFDEVHYLPGVTRGKNNVMIGDLGQRPLRRSDGVLVVPVQSTPTGPDGTYYNPGAGFTYTDALCLFGRWQTDGSLEWTSSERVAGDPARTTRGLIEPTLAELDGGRLLMVMRGSNDARPDLPGYRWAAVSDDGGETWSRAEPWTFDTGESFYSPSSCSQLVHHSDGRIFWVGNICGSNPAGNRPRYPIVIGEVDPRSGLLVASSVTPLDDQGPEDSEYLTLSNFYVREDRQTGRLVLYLPRAFARGQRREDGSYYGWPLLQYEIEV